MGNISYCEMERHISTKREPIQFNSIQSFI